MLLDLSTQFGWLSFGVNEILLTQYISEFLKGLGLGFRGHCHLLDVGNNNLYNSAY